MFFSLLQQTHRKYGGRAMAISFQIAHPNFCHRSRTPPFPRIDGPEQILTTKTTRKTLSRGCPRLRLQPSLTFHKRSYYAAFENRPPCLCFFYIIKGLRRRHGTLRKYAFHTLSLVPYALHLNIDADLRRVPCRAFSA